MSPSTSLSLRLLCGTCTAITSPRYRVAITQMRAAQDAAKIMTRAIDRLTTDLATGPMATILRGMGLDGKLNAPDLLRTTVVDEEPLNPRLLFEHDYQPGQFRFASKLLSTYDQVWNSLGFTIEQRLNSAELFALHEFVHVPGLSTYNCDLSDGAANVEQAIDYQTDAAAIDVQRALFSYRGASDRPAAEMPGLIQGVLSGMQVFDSIDGAKPPAPIPAARVIRKLAWHYQHARAIHHSWGDQFNLFCEPRLGIARSIDDGATWTDVLAQSSIGPQDLSTGLMKLSVYQHNTGCHAVISGPATELTVPLIAGIWSASARLSQPAFRRLFGTYPALVGRTR
jgi:hypothetical protein